MADDPRAALDQFIAALERHFTSASQRRSELDPVVVDAYDALAAAFERYDEALFTAYDEVTPFVLSEDDEELDDDDEDDDLDDEDLDEDDDTEDLDADDLDEDDDADLDEDADDGLGEDADDGPDGGEPATGAASGQRTADALGS